VNLWRVVAKVIDRLPRKDSQILLHLESLVTSGFRSRRRSIVNISIATWNSTFGKEESLRYPPRLEQALRRLRNSVELSLPSLVVRPEDAVSACIDHGVPSLMTDQDNKLSFYDSDTSADDIKRPFKSPRVKQSPFKITKPRRKSKSQSPAVPSSASRRVLTRQTPKARLRHDNSQIQFEPIASTPTNPFNQESQVLTERQKEILGRQRLNTGLFAKMGAPSPQPEEVPSPMEIHSDAMTADDLPDHASRTTPLKALAAMGPMDAFLGSSPTPHARRSTQKIVSDNTDVVTPTAVRNIKFAPNDDLGSSPPRFEKDTDSKPGQTNSDVLVSSSFEYRQPENSHSVSFDEGTTIDEEAMLNAVAHHDIPQMDSDMADDTIMSELPSSTIDLQLTAQIDADMQAHVDTKAEPTDDAVPESNAEFVDAASHQQSSIVEDDHAGSDTEVEDSQTPTRATAGRPKKNSQADTSSTSRVGDSFNKASSVNGTPKTHDLRRSSRHSTGSPAQPPSSKKRKQTPSKSDKKTKKTQEEAQEIPTPSQEPAAQPEEEEDDDGMLDNIIVASPTPKPSQTTKSKKRKSTSLADSHVVVPETNRKLNLRRSQSLLSQVENSQDIDSLVIVEDTPAPKRARQSLDKDVSEAKKTTPTPTAGSTERQTKRLSHVEIVQRPGSSSSNFHPSPTTQGWDIPAAMSISLQDTNAKPTPEPPATEMLPQGTPTRSFAERVILTPRSIINQLKTLKDYLFSAPANFVLAREEEREIDDVMFDIRRQVHAAGLRGEGRKDRE
jgi:hypothetical protein